MLYMSNIEGGKDLTGFHCDWDGWYVLTKKEKESKIPVIVDILGNVVVPGSSILTHKLFDGDPNYYWQHIKGEQMEYMTCDKDGKYGHIRLRKSGSMEIVKNEFNHNDWCMEVRMVQPLNVKTK